MAGGRRNPGPGHRPDTRRHPVTPGRWRAWGWFAGLYLASVLTLLAVVSLVRLLLPLPD